MSSRLRALSSALAFAFLGCGTVASAMPSASHRAPVAAAAASRQAPAGTAPAAPAHTALPLAAPRMPVPRRIDVPPDFNNPLKRHRMAMRGGVPGFRHAI